MTIILNCIMIYMHTVRGSKREACADPQVDESKRGGNERVGANGEGLGEVLSAVA